MHPYITARIAEQRVADMRAAADARRQLKAAQPDGAGLRARRRSWQLPRRHSRRLELTWPDGVCSVVPADRAPTRPARSTGG